MTNQGYTYNQPFQSNFFSSTQQSNFSPNHIPNIDPLPKIPQANFPLLPRANGIFMEEKSPFDSQHQHQHQQQQQPPFTFENEQIHQIVNGIPAHFSSQHMRLYKTNEGFIQPQSVYNQSSPSNANLKKRPQFERVEKPAPKKRRHGLKSRNLPKDKSVVLKKWLSENTNHPYPTEQEKEYFSKTLSMTLSQINNWFINARRRILIDGQLIETVQIELTNTTWPQKPLTQTKVSQRDAKLKEAEKDFWKSNLELSQKYLNQENFIQEEVLNLRAVVPEVPVELAMLISKDRWDKMTDPKHKEVEEGFVLEDGYEEEFTDDSNSDSNSQKVRSSLTIDELSESSHDKKELANKDNHQKKSNGHEKNQDQNQNQNQNEKKKFKEIEKEVVHYQNEKEDPESMKISKLGHIFQLTRQMTELAARIDGVVDSVIGNSNLQGSRNYWKLGNPHFEASINAILVEAFSPEETIKYSSMLEFIAFYFLKIAKESSDEDAVPNPASFLLS